MPFPSLKFDCCNDPFTLLLIASILYDIQVKPINRPPIVSHLVAIFMGMSL
jgi:hypothetical protein